jgi:hypothetical protein
VTKRDRNQLGGLSHSRAHMKEIGARGNKGRPRRPTYDQVQADPRVARRLRELTREFKQEVKHGGSRTTPVALTGMAGTLRDFD